MSNGRSSDKLVVSRCMVATIKRCCNQRHFKATEKIGCAVGDIRACLEAAGELIIGWRPARSGKPHDCAFTAKLDVLGSYQ